MGFKINTRYSTWMAFRKVKSKGACCLQTQIKVKFGGHATFKANKDEKKKLLFRVIPLSSCWWSKPVARRCQDKFNHSTSWLHFVQMSLCCPAVQSHGLTLTLCHQSQLEITSCAPSPTPETQPSTTALLAWSEVMWIVYLRKISVSNLTFIALLSSEGVATEAAARVDVALLGHRADHAAAAVLQTNRQEI